ncbi:MFS transporter [Wolbachia endosymbiont of Psylliodes chrysocephala]|uniref:MFS transporter n=1 Tax=Wolbachia endosymbiont of Psylliodes chrysocephala TaxID=2883236 RepID=UPI0020A1D14C|nr:MFS transporter [Wolbachia endosymbiont of Psylliodes chrysocephala]
MNFVFFQYLLFFFGYVLLYFSRQSIPIALPLLIDTDHVKLSYFFACFSFFYGVSKFFNGIIMDFKDNPLFMFGLCNIVTGISTIGIILSYNNLTLLLLTLILLAWAQGVGWPAITKFMITNSSISSIASLWGVMSASQQLGSCLTLIVLPSIIKIYGVKSAFLYSGLLCLLFGIYITLKAYYRESTTPTIYKVQKPKIGIKVTSSIWFLCYATFCTYIIKMGIFFWFPIILKDRLQISLVQSSLITGVYDLGGILGTLITGRISDMYFFQNRSLLALLYMLGIALTFIGMNFCQNIVLMSLGAALSGFFIFGVQVLTGVIAVDIAPQNNVCTIVSLTGLFGYIASSIFSCVVLGLLVECFGNNMMFSFFFICSVIISICFCVLSSRNLKQRIRSGEWFKKQ